MQNQSGPTYLPGKCAGNDPWLQSAEEPYGLNSVSKKQRCSASSLLQRREDEGDGSLQTGLDFDSGVGMRAMILETAGSPLRLAELPLPQPASDEVLIRVRACGVCRTDLHVA